MGICNSSVIVNTDTHFSSQEKLPDIFRSARVSGCITFFLSGVPINYIFEKSEFSCVAKQMKQ
ncbi:hypothetical protein, partial [Enterobacter cloacae complex sp. 4DZ3-17B2]|uniref:hypothetical protein n=1 Tax=Enterobacter cloacae complex sp. 4DZ3-17B2 TaxID=2511990 RepID=UPI001CA5AC58